MEETKGRMGRKGQISIEYVICLVLFIVFSMYILMEITRYVPLYIKEVKGEMLNSEAYQLSEILVNDRGQPNNWDSLWDSTPASVKRFGLSDSSSKVNVLSMAKAAKLDEICNANKDNDYKSTANRLGVDETGRFMDVSLTNLVTGQMIIQNCNPGAQVQGKETMVVRRIVVFDTGGYGELTIKLW